VSDERLLIRLQRLEQQIRAFRELHTREIAHLATTLNAPKLDTIGRLQADELQLILDQLADIVADLTPKELPTATAADPAAASPKRAQWLAEQERKSAPRSRRELLRGRGDDPTS
jgi:hypothetical protein